MLYYFNKIQHLKYKFCGFGTRKLPIGWLKRLISNVLIVQVDQKNWIFHLLTNLQSNCSNTVASVISSKTNTNLVFM